MIGLVLLTGALPSEPSRLRLYAGHVTTRPAGPAMGDTIVVRDAFFINCFATVDGGAISHFSPDAGTLSVTRTTFVNCRSGRNPGDGGCIYFSGESSRISSCCVFRCFAGRDGHSFCVSIRGGRPNPNHVNLTTVTNCGDASVGWQTLYLGFGQIRIWEYNSTNNSVYFQAAAFMIHTMDSDANASFLTVCHDNGPWIVYFFGRAGSTIRSANFIANRCRGYPELPGSRTMIVKGVFYFHKYGRIVDCVVLGNDGELFKGNRPGAEVVVANCVFDRDIGQPSGVRAQQCTVGRGAQTHRLTHMNTALCARR
jgi:hypothetical protein